MGLKARLEAELGGVSDFEDPIRDLEQYRTPASVAAHLVALADLEGDIEGQTVIDLGTGTGMLALAAALRSPDRVMGVEIDPAALEQARANERSLSSMPVDWIRGDATALPVDLAGTTVVANPPFGAHEDNRHADREFLETIAGDAAVSYTIHNEGSREFLEAFTMDNGGRITHAYGVEFHIPKQFRHHDSTSQTIQAELYRVVWD
ncbi:METTL5 family protein [Halodesulfurarchaeum formicicum]|uniref:RNA methylase n=1 Tax=Halodesulfurarchaeum formicicum TaxID=1873524 RepID=A0A1J1ACF1_9EURY|nr:METTL5 family protein [Halodesulfurarchaeum formicicum]APE95822.1 RNA methylase [Halodesulfurarchaeum formicicum]